MFEVSDKVVCIDDGPGNGKNKYLGKPLPIHKGVIYVVSGTAISCTGIPMLYLVGINMDISPITGREYGFRACRFRKLSEIKAENAERAKASQKSTLSDYDAVTRAMFRFMLDEDNYRQA